MLHSELSANCQAVAAQPEPGRAQAKLYDQAKIAECCTSAPLPKLLRLVQPQVLRRHLRRIKVRKSSKFLCQ